jgi:hypothetical protein
MRAFTSTRSARRRPKMSVSALFGVAPTMTDAERVAVLERDLRELRAVLWYVWSCACDGQPESRPRGPGATQTAWEQVTPVFHRWFPR